MDLECVDFGWLMIYAAVESIACFSFKNDQPAIKQNFDVLFRKSVFDNLRLEKPTHQNYRSCTVTLLLILNDIFNQTYCLFTNGLKHSRKYAFLKKSLPGFALTISSKLATCVALTSELTVFRVTLARDVYFHCLVREALPVGCFMKAIIRCNSFSSPETSRGCVHIV